MTSTNIWAEYRASSTSVIIQGFRISSVAWVKFREHVVLCNFLHVTPVTMQREWHGHVVTINHASIPLGLTFFDAVLQPYLYTSRTPLTQTYFFCIVGTGTWPWTRNRGLSRSPQPRLLHTFVAGPVLQTLVAGLRGDYGSLQ